LVVLLCATVGAIGRTRARRYAATLLACAVASLVTPYGMGNLGYIVDVSTNPIIRERVTEWAPTSIDQLEGIIVFASAAVLGGVAVVSSVRLSRGEVITLLAFGIVALASVRGVVWFGFVLAPIAARLLVGLPWPRRAARRERPVLNAAILVTIVAVTMLSLPWTKHLVPGLPESKRGLVSSNSPVRVAAYLQTHDAPPSGRMLNFELWGGYFDWAVWPRHQAFLDGRYELYPTRVWLDYLALVGGSARWRELLDTYDISYAVLSPSEQPELVALLRQAPDWRVEYADGQAILLVRQARAGV
jgi:hypothetical protein